LGGKTSNPLPEDDFDQLQSLGDQDLQEPARKSYVVKAGSSDLSSNDAIKYSSTDKKQKAKKKKEGAVDSELLTEPS